MPSSDPRRTLGVVAVLLAEAAFASRAEAQPQPQNTQGFAVERFYPSAPGAGWFFMDDLDMRGGFGGAMSLTTGYARVPLQVTDSLHHLAVVSDRAFADFAFAATYDRFRVYFNLDAPLLTQGQSGAVGDYAFTAPSVDPGASPDTFADPRVGVDARLLGQAESPFRLGASAQLIIPNGNRSDYDTDGTYRAMGRILFAGNAGLFAYAGQMGVHVRPLDDSPAPGSPQGSELLFGVAGGARVPLRGRYPRAFVVGPEVSGATAFRSFLSSTGTALEGLLTGRLEGTADDGPQIRIKLGAGTGLTQHFGAPEWRLLFAIELFDHSSDRDKDGVSDSQDACPDAPGARTHDVKTNGCPTP